MRESGDSCENNDQCAEGLVCVDECKEPGNANDRCYADDQCSSGNECLDFACVDSENRPTDE